MERGRGNPLRSVCDGCEGRWQGQGEGEGERVEWREGRRLCSSCSHTEDAVSRFLTLTQGGGELACPRVEDVEEAIP